MDETANIVTFYCNYGQHMVEYQRTGLGTGYAYPSKNTTEKICYDCCANQDRDLMAAEGRYTLYLIVANGNGKYEVANWPGTLRFPVTHMVTRKHNWGMKVYHAWFHGPDGHIWHSITVGDNTQRAHARRTAKRWDSQPVPK